jgi:hypothetical protein
MTDDASVHIATHCDQEKDESQIEIWNLRERIGEILNALSYLSIPLWRWYIIIKKMTE